MRNSPNLRIERHRLRNEHFASSSADGNNGFFMMPHPSDRSLVLRCLCSDGGGWDHVSVSLAYASSGVPHERTPTWAEMVHVRDTFFRDDETVMELHVPKARHVNHHNYTLHLWRPQNQDVPAPPGIFVGPTNRKPMAEMTDGELTALMEECGLAMRSVLPPKTLFTTIAWGEGVAQYVSNTNREDAIKGLRKFVDLLEQKEESPRVAF